MRAISDYVAEHFRANGFPEVVSHELREGKQVIAFDGGAVAVAGPFASDSEIIAAARKAHNMTDDNIETVQAQGVATASPEATQVTGVLLPVVEPVSPPVAPAPAAPRRSAPVTPGDHAASIQDMMADHVRAVQDIRDASLMTLRISLERQLRALEAAPKAVAQKIDGQTDDFLSLMGQFTNDLGV